MAGARKLWWGKLSTVRQSRAYLPIADWLFSYQKDWLRPDVIAGLTTAAVVIPKAMAYATIAGLPVQVGLYTALVPMTIYAVMGSSRPLSVSTTTTIAVLTATELGDSRAWRRSVIPPQGFSNVDTNGRGLPRSCFVAAAGLYR